MVARAFIRVALSVLAAIVIHGMISYVLIALFHKFNYIPGTSVSYAVLFGLPLVSTAIAFFGIPLMTGAPWAARVCKVLLFPVAAMLVAFQTPLIACFLVSSTYCI